MENLLERLPSGSRISIIRLRSLGDCVLTTPAVSLLKSHRPDLKITIVVEPRFSAVFEDNSDIDEIRAGAARCDLVLNLHGGTRSMILTVASRARFRAGFAHHRYSFVYSHRIPTAQEILGVNVRSIRRSIWPRPCFGWECHRARFHERRFPPDRGLTFRSTR